jgi:TRAP-type C4-dicarboxylate transport system permease large subunit
MVSLPALFTPFIIIGGKIFGWFTATESACIAVLYAGALSLWVYREMDLKGLYGALLDTGKLSACFILRRDRERVRLCSPLQIQRRSSTVCPPGA